MPDTFEPRPGPAPAGYRSLTTFFAVHDCAAALDFYQRGFGAELIRRIDTPDGLVMHAEMRIADSMFQLSEPLPAFGIVGPPERGNAFTMLMWTEDPDGVYARAVSAGATGLAPVEDTFSGDRMGVLRCPFGVRWCIARHDRDVPDDEIAAAARAWFTSGGS